MLIYDKTETEGDIDVETKAYFSNKKKGVLNISQGLYKGAEVLSHSSVTLNAIQYAQIVIISSKLQIEKFLKDYKTE